MVTIERQVQAERDVGAPQEELVSFLSLIQLVNNATGTQVIVGPINVGVSVGLNTIQEEKGA